MEMDRIEGDEAGTELGAAGKLGDTDGDSEGPEDG
jgi:hypothetical protein